MKRGNVIPKRILELVLIRDRWECQAKLACCWINRGLAPHHKKFRSRGGSNDPINLVTLCQPCHAAVHAQKPGTERWRTFRWQDEGQTESDTGMKSAAFEGSFDGDGCAV